MSRSIPLTEENFATLKLSTPNKQFVVATGGSEFTKWLAARFAEPVEITRSVITAVANKFDSLEHEGACFRGDLLVFLTMNEGARVVGEP